MRVCPIINNTYGVKSRVAKDKKNSEQDSKEDQTAVQEQTNVTDNKEDNQDNQNEQQDQVCLEDSEIQKVLTAMAEKNKLVEELNDRYKRLQADFDNFRRRSRQEKDDLSKVVAQNVIFELLPILDNFERAIGSAASQDAASLLTGVEMIYRQFVTILEKLDVAPVKAVGEQFDPQKHEAVMRIEDPDQPDGLIVEELQKGYIAKGKVIRPSMVKVVGNN